MNTQTTHEPGLDDGPAPAPLIRDDIVPADPFDEVASAIVADSLADAAEHNHAWRIPGGGE